MQSTNTFYELGFKNKTKAAMFNVKSHFDSKVRNLQSQFDSHVYFVSSRMSDKLYMLSLTCNYFKSAFLRIFNKY